MNENFKTYVRKTKKSIYKISKETGIPYTTLNELMNDKSHINQITSETTCKLCLYFDCSPQDLLDDFPLLQNSSGKYLGLRYQWHQTKDGIEFHVEDNNEDIVLTKLKMMVPNKYHYYQHEIPELLIETYLEDKKEWEALP